MGVIFQFPTQQCEEEKSKSARRPIGLHFRTPNIKERRSQRGLVLKTEHEKEKGDAWTIAINGKKAMHDLLNKIDAQWKSRSANWKVTGSRMPQPFARSRSSRVNKPTSKNNSRTGGSTAPREMDIDEDLLDKIMGSNTESRTASNSFLNKQRARASQVRRSSDYVSTIAPRVVSRAELDRRFLSTDDIESMFAGAPHFTTFIHDGRIQPVIEYHGGSRDIIEGLHADCVEITGHSSFRKCTLATRSSHQAGSVIIHEFTAGASSIDTLVETPNMLSFNGTDPGTVGIEHFLQSQVRPEILDDEDALGKRKVLLDDPESLGLRQLNLETVISRLRELSELLTTLKEELADLNMEVLDFWNEDKIEELGEDLFSKVLSSDLGTTSAGTGSVTMSSQISALQHVLDLEDLWRDFSQAEWRTRVGEVLWAPENFHTTPDGMCVERNVLLLQIALAAELLVRLHVLEVISAARVPLQKPMRVEDAKLLERGRTQKVKWDLLLAQRFLENVDISAQTTEENDNKKLHRSSLWSAVTFMTARSSPDESEPTIQPIFLPKREKQQLDGVVAFAEAIDWPHWRTLRGDLETRLDPKSQRQDGILQPVPLVRRASSHGSTYETPLASPMLSISARWRTAFSDFEDQHLKRPSLARAMTVQSVQLSPASTGPDIAFLERCAVGGWLSRSWLSGLVMPGEVAGHLLISSLLENSPQAMTALGSEANLYGGFAYEDRSYWSKHCVVGRVLAASRDAIECMGWISIPEPSSSKKRPQIEDGWIKLDVKEVPGASVLDALRADCDQLSRVSDPLHGEKIGSVQAGDFSSPIDGPIVMGNEVRYEGFSLSHPREMFTRDSSLPMASLDTNEPAVLKAIFSSPTNSRISNIEVELKYDVYFVSSYPCRPQRPMMRTVNGARLIAPMSKALFENDDETGSNNFDQKKPVDSTQNSGKSSPTTPRSIVDKELPAPPAHPLHMDYHFDIIPVATLLSTPTQPRPRAMSPPTAKRSLTAANKSDLQHGIEATSFPSASDSEDIVILDCRGIEDLEVLARAWCAEVGEHAIIGNSQRTCLACCVREARALGICVVIRT